MIYQNIGKSELKASVIGQGTGQFGTTAWGFNSTFFVKDLRLVIKKCLDVGINLFDTSETYGDGKSEYLIGKFLNENDRDDFIIISKVAPWNLRYYDIIKAAKNSLKRLNLKAIDLYMIHYPNPFIPLKESISAMEYLKKNGIIKNIGLSNFNKNLLCETNHLLKKYEIVANEVQYNLFSKEIEKDLLPYCQRNNISIIAFSPLAGGLLTDRYLNNNLPRDRAHAFNFYNKKYFFQKNSNLFTYIKELSEKKNVTFSQVCLAYITNQQKCFAIPASLSVNEVIDNSNSILLKLNANEKDKLRYFSHNLDFVRYFYDNKIIRPISWVKGGFRARKKL